MEFKRLKNEVIDKAKEVDILFIAEAMGDELTRSGRSYFAYQNQGEMTPSVAITPSKGMWKNFGGTEGGFDAISYYAYRNFNTCKPEGKEFIESVKAVCQLAGITLEYEDGSTEQPTGETPSTRQIFRKKEEEDESAPREKIERLDYVYRTWMKQLSLSELHIQHLSEVRKISDAAAIIREYRTFSEGKSERYRSVRDILAITGEPIGVPGFALCQGKYNRPYWTALGRAGMLIPFRDIFNRIQGFQNRFDIPPKVLKREGRLRTQEPQFNQIRVICPDSGEILWQGTREQLPIELPNGKVWLEDGHSYSWFASATFKKHGILLGTLMGDPVPYHCAVPSRILAKWKPGIFISKVMNTETVWWGEGPLKGDIASDFTDELHLQAPGVNSWRVLIEPTLAIQPKRVILGFDADAQTKKGVQDNVLNCIQEAKKHLSPKDIELLIAIWPYNQAKGKDDLFNAGYRPQIISIPDTTTTTLSLV